MKTPKAARSLWASLTSIFDPTEKNKHLVAILGVVVAVAAGVAAILAQNDDPIDGAWVESVEKACVVADKRIDAGHELIVDISTMGPGNLPADQTQLFALLRRSSDGLKIPAEAARTFAYNVAKVTHAEMHDRIAPYIEKLNSSSTKIDLFTQSGDKYDPANPASLALIMEQISGVGAAISDMRSAFQSIGLLGPDTCKEIFHDTEIG
ncbi:hypothetical protein [Sphaerisporangium dianthi]|uniref:Uncharacterized protein n=1 Tax=Sphaerisporangium dianthi TaxID=1436120 RepID=A0ABV9CV70_9ACTN